MNYETKQLSKLEDCNLILTNKDESLVVGLCYEKDRDPEPYVVVKEDSPLFCHFIIMAAKALGIHIEEDSILAKEIFATVDDLDFVAGDYFKSLAIIYGRIYTVKKQGKFESELYKDFQKAYYLSEKQIFTRIYKNWMKGSREVLSNLNRNSTRNLSETLKQLAKLKDLEFQESYYPLLNAHVFTFEQHDDSKGELNFWLMAMVDSSGKIYVGNQYVFQDFDADKMDDALGMIKSFVKKKDGSVRTYRAYTKDFDISQETYDSAVNSMKRMLEKNLVEKGIEFKFYNSKTVVTVYLHRRLSRKMFMLVITFKEYLRNQKVFKKLIAYPHKKTKWNFWCHEMKYKWK